jgi:DNA modification methylase
MNNIQNMDAVAFLKSLPPHSVDCIISDPPWGVDFVSSEVSGAGNFDDSSEYVKGLAFNCCREFARVLKPGGHVYIICAQYDYWWKMYLSQFLHFNNVIGCMAYTKPPYAGCFDYSLQCVYFASNGFPHSFNVLPNSLKSLRPDIVSNLKRFRSDSLHACMKNEKMLRDFVLWSCPVGGIVLDPFLGSGVIISAANSCNRFVWGSELSSDYYSKIVEKYLKK